MSWEEEEAIYELATICITEDVFRIVFETQRLTGRQFYNHPVFIVAVKGVTVRIS